MKINEKGIWRRIMPGVHLHWILTKNGWVPMKNEKNVDSKNNK